MRKKLFLFLILIAAFMLGTPSASALTTSVDARFTTIEPNETQPIVIDWDVHGSGYILVVQPNTGPMVNPADLPNMVMTPPDMRSTIVEALGDHKVASYYEFENQDPQTNFETIFPTMFAENAMNGVASTSVPGEYQVLFVFWTGLKPDFICVSDTFVVTGLAVVPEPSMIATVTAISAAVAVFMGFKLSRKGSIVLKF